MKKKQEIQNDISVNLLKDLREIIARGRAVAYAAVNAAMIDTYWKIGQRIVEEEQHGSKRAEYGTALIQHLAEQLCPDFGNGFCVGEIRRKEKQLYLDFAVEPLVPYEKDHYNCSENPR